MKRENLTCRDCNRLMRLPNSEDGVNWIDHGKTHWHGNGTSYCKEKNFKIARS